MNFLIYIFFKFLILNPFYFNPNTEGLIHVKNEVFEVWYNEKFEQPIKLIYKSANRGKKILRNKFNFYKPKNIHTSDDKDYYKNIWDKGHLAPAASFSDTKENLRATFSYLNCALQNQYLNRGLWKTLENKERVWDDEEILEVTVEVNFDENHTILDTGAHVPDYFLKHIFFTEQNNWICFKFKNIKPKDKLENYKVSHKH